MRKLKEFFKKHNILSIIIICLVFGIGGGAIGQVILGNYFITAPYSGNIDISQGKYKDSGLVISNAKNVIVQQDAKIDETVNSVSGSLVGIYKKQKAVKTGAAFSPDNYYKLSDAAGQGFIVTSDGWMLTAMPLDKNFANYVAITRDKKIYPIEKIANDPLTGFNFFKVAGRDFPVRKFGQKSDIKQGNLAVGITWSGLSWVSFVLGFSDQGAPAKSSDNFSGKLLLAGGLPPELNGSVIFNLAGDALGIADAKGAVEPMAHLASAADSLFKNKIIKRPSLGLNYFDLSRLAPIEAQADSKQAGAVIYKDPKGTAIVKNSAAEKAGLREGDVIAAIDNIKLDKDNDLAEIILRHAPGDKITLLVKSGGTEKEVAAVLGERK